MLAGATACLALCAMALPAGAAPFTYQGELTQNGQPAAGDFDLRFQMYTSATGDILLLTVYVDDYVLSNGRFAAEIDPEGVLTGFDRWIAVAVRPGSVPNEDRSDGSYTALSPRQLITPAPYATMALDAKGLYLPIDEQLNSQSAPGIKITNGVGTALAGYSTTGTGIRADSPSGFAIYASSTDGWAAFLQGSVHVSNRLALAYNQPTTLTLACNGNAAKPGGGSWTALSDRRLKQNIHPLTGALDRLMKLRGCTFEYTPEAQERGLTLPGEQIGFIAQEVEQVFPEWVGEDEDGMKFVTERGTTALLVEALREMRAETDALKKEVAGLRARLGEGTARP
jgi:hypothetical protein